MLHRVRRCFVAVLLLAACGSDPSAPADGGRDADAPPPDEEAAAAPLDATAAPDVAPPPEDVGASIDEPAAAAPDGTSRDESDAAPDVAAPDQPTGLVADVAGPPPDATPAAGPDAAREAGVDAAPDATRDAALDAARDATLDATRDVTPDLPADVAADARPDVAPPPPTSEVLSPAGAAWRYLDDGTNPGALWATAGFRDAAWRTGAAQLGYGDGDEATVVRYGPDPARKHITTYFRRTFTVADPAAFRFVVLRLLRDDGAAVYLNGREARRDVLPEGALTPATLASLTVASPEEGVFHERLVDPSLLVAGANTLAVELHQAAPDSSDLSFDLELVGLRASLVAPEADPTLLAVGDISTCRNADDDATARILDAIAGPVITLGDTVYDSGTADEFSMCFDPSWGRHRARIRPAVGNHEYYTPGAAPYYRYFGAAAGDPARGYYSFDVGAWHLVALNSNCAEVGGCEAGSPQDRWLVADLAASRARCTLAYWHHPLYTSGTHGPAADVANLYRRLYDANADLVLNGHEHDYERFAPQDAAGRADPARGIRQFVVGTGGVELRWFLATAANSEARDVATHGVLRLVLRPAGYAWRFLPTAGGAFTDAGEARCH